MAGMIDSYEAAVLDYIVSAAGTTVSPTNWWAVLFTAAPGEDGTGGTEVSVGGGSLYERVSIPSASWDASATLGQPSTIANDVAIAFPTAGAAWGTVTHYGLAPAGVEGVADVKWWNVITASKVVDTGDDVSFAIGALVLQLGDPGDTYS